MKRLPRNIAAALLLLTPLLAACSMMSEDRSHCPTCYNPLYVTFRYNYNMQRADMFNDHVGAVTCYVVNQQGRIVARQHAANTAVSQPLRSRTYDMEFTGLPAGTYRLWAVAAQRDFEGTTAADPAPRQLSVGDAITDLAFSAPSTTVALDTLWHGTNARELRIDDYNSATDTVSLMRLTNNLSIMLMQTEASADISHTDYAVSILRSSAQLDHEAAEVATLQQPVTPYAQWTTETVNDATGEVALRTAHYDLSLGRLFSHDDASRNARLHVVTTDDNTPIIDMDLIQLLAIARSATGRTYPIQEFLDREYDYHLDLVLDGNQWKYIVISISVLNWSLRIQNEAL